MNRVPTFLVLVLAASVAAAQGGSATKVRLKRAALEKDAVVLDLRIDPGWHIYAITSEYDDGNATKVAVEKPAEIAGPIVEPKPHHVKKDYKDSDTGEVIYTQEYDSHEGEITIRIPVKGANAPSVKGSITFSACDADRCLEASTLRFTAETSNGSAHASPPNPPMPPPGPSEPESKATPPARKVIANPPRLGKAPPRDPLTVVEISYPDPITSEVFDVRVVVEIASGYHIYGLSKETTGVATAFSFPKPGEKDLAAIVVGAGDARPDPPAKRREKQFEKYDYFDGRVAFDVPVRAMWLPESTADRSASVAFPVRLAIDYQTCTWDHCLLPGKAEFDLPATVTGGPHVLQVLTENVVPGPKVAEAPIVDSVLSFEPPTLEPNAKATILVRLKRRDGKPIVADGHEPRIELGQAQYLFVDGPASATAEPDGSVVVRLPVEVSADAPDTRIPIGGRAAIGEVSAQFQGEASIFAPLIGFLIIAALSALGALLTPCVFPMIPVTVSIFTKQAEAGAQHPAKLGVLYCVGIVASFTAIGAIFTAALSGDAANVFAQHWITQLVIAGLFVFFALSLLGLFDLAVPQPIMNMVERSTTRRLALASEGHGASITVLLMGLLFAITTFTCTAPFIGGLLAGASASGEWTKPILGMLVFSSVLAIPFFFLAVFPAQLKKLPKSGGWLNETKVVMGFIELAAAVKFLNGADLSLDWEIFTRNVCLAMWIAIFGLTGVYLLGVFRLPKDAPRQKTGVIPLLIAGAFITLSIYLTTGLNGKPLGKFIEGWLPPVEEVYAAQLERAARGGECAEGKTGYANRFKDDFEAALAEAKTLDVPLFIDFTGFT